jgi:hypothetical protein
VDYYNEPDYYILVLEYFGTAWGRDNSLLSPEVHERLVHKSGHDNTSLDLSFLRSVETDAKTASVIATSRAK